MGLNERDQASATIERSRHPVAASSVWRSAFLDL